MADYALSQDGRYVSFESDASNLTSSSQGYDAVYLRDRFAGTTTMMSTSVQGQPANDESEIVGLSYDGKKVYFISYGNNLVANTPSSPNPVPTACDPSYSTCSNPFYESLYVKDLNANTVTALPLTSDGNVIVDQYGNPTYFFNAYAMSPDGRFITYETPAANEPGGNQTGNAQCYVDDTFLNTLTLVSVAPDGTPGNQHCPTIWPSPDGQTYLVGSHATNLTPGPAAFANLYIVTKNDSFTVQLTNGQTQTITIQEPINGASFTQGYHLNPTLAAGANQFAVASIDAAGNIATPVSMGAITLDQVAPNILTTSPANGFYTNSLTVNVSGTTDKILAAATINGIPATLGADQQSFSGQAVFASAGSVSAVVTVTDLAGNTTSQSIPITIEITPPTILSLYPGNGAYFTGLSIPVYGTASEGLSAATINGVPAKLSVTATSFSGTATFSDQGAYNILVSVTDMAGNTTTQTIPIWIITSPATLSNISVPTIVSQDNLTFSISATASEPVVSASVNGVPLTISQNGLAISGNYTATSSGPLTLNIQVTDQIGNVTTTTQVVQVQSPSTVGFVSQANIQFNSGTQSTMSMQGSLGALTVTGASNVTVAFGEFQQTIPLNSFSVNGQVYNFQPGANAPGVSQLTLDFGAGAFSLSLANLYFTDLASPVLISLTLDNQPQECEMIAFQEAQNPWTFQQLK